MKKTNKLGLPHMTAAEIVVTPPPAAQGTPTQRKYLLSRLSAMLEVHKQRIFSSLEKVTGQLAYAEGQERKARGEPHAEQWRRLVAAARDLSDELRGYESATRLKVWEGKPPMQMLLGPFGKPEDHYKIRERAKEKNQQRFAALMALYQDARGQILFKEKAVALDYIEMVEQKAAKI